MIGATGQTTFELDKLHSIRVGWRGFAYSNPPRHMPLSAVFTFLAYSMQQGVYLGAIPATTCMRLR